MPSQPDFKNSFAAVMWMLGPLAPLVGAAIITPLLTIGVPKHATREFYSAAADVGVVVLVALAIEARLFRLRGIPRVSLVNPSKRFTDDRARKMWITLYVLEVLGVAGIVLWVQKAVLLTLARGDYARASARGVFAGLVFGLIAVVLAGLMLPARSD